MDSAQESDLALFSEIWSAEFSEIEPPLYPGWFFASMNKFCGFLASKFGAIEQDRHLTAHTRDILP